VSRAVERLLPGIDVPGGQGCCGALHAHNGASRQGEEMARDLGRALPGVILTTAGGCAAHLADVLGRDKVRELSEYLCERWAGPGAPALARVRAGGGGGIRQARGAGGPGVPGGRVARVALQDSCQARNGLGIAAQPRSLLERVADYVELPSAGVCCGGAGTYSMLRPDDANRILDPKLDEIERADLDYLVTVNPVCQRQVQQGLARRRSRVRVVHLAELLAASMEGASGA